MVHINRIYENKKAMQILEFFIDNPSGEISQIEIIKKTKMAKATAVKWSKLLVKKKFLNLRKIGVTNLYSLNNDNAKVKNLKAGYILLELDNLIDYLWNKKIELYVYGSAARGDYTENSDIDLLIIGKIKRDEIIEKTEKFSEKIKRKINFQIFNQIEWTMMENKDKAYYERVEKDKIQLI